MSDISLIGFKKNSMDCHRIFDPPTKLALLSETD